MPQDKSKVDISGVVLIIGIVVTVILVIILLNWLLSDYWPIIDGLWFFIGVAVVIYFALKLLG